MLFGYHVQYKFPKLGIGWLHVRNLWLAVVVLLKLGVGIGVNGYLKL